MHFTMFQIFTIETFFRRDPGAIKWGEAGANYVVESTGVFTTKETASVSEKFLQILGTYVYPYWRTLYQFFFELSELSTFM